LFHYDLNQFKHVKNLYKKLGNVISLKMKTSKELLKRNIQRKSKKYLINGIIYDRGNKAVQEETKSKSQEK